MSGEREPLEDFEADELIEAAVNLGSEYELVIRMLLHISLWTNEFAHLREAWINFQKDEIRVPAKEGDWSPNCAAGSQIIPLRDPHTKRVLRNWCSVHGEIGMSQTCSLTPFAALDRQGSHPPVSASLLTSVRRRSARGGI